ncbi:pentatricopeptide repeat-containing protein [Tanacetum coccineum]
MSSKCAHIVNQFLTAIIQNRPFDTHLAKSASLAHHFNHPHATEIVTEVLRSVPRYFFQSTRSIGRQTGFRHRAPLKQRNLHDESMKVRKGVMVLGPGAYRDPVKVKLGLDKAVEFYYWVESEFGFKHTEMTCREMGIILVKGNRIKALYNFLKDMTRRNGASGVGLVTTETMTCLVKVLGEQGLVNEALGAFYRMKQFHCKPDVCAYNTVIYALCKVGNFKMAKFLFEQMELPGFRCPPDTFTYTILISSYCKHSLQTGCKKAIRRRMWEANHLFRIMLFKGFKPDVVTYNCLIDGCCKTYRIERALELFNDMEKQGHGVPSTSSYTPIIHAFCEAGKVLEAWNVLVELVDRGSIPREYTYRLVHESMKSVGKMDMLDNEVCGRIEHGIKNRCKEVLKVKPVISAKPKFTIGGNCDMQ